MTQAFERAPELAGSDFELRDRYERHEGRVHLTGIQALARVPIDQARADRAEGRLVGTYISGYEGSPLAGYDLELLRQTALLDEHDITFEPGLNEEAATMAVQGAQLIDGLDPRVEGVVGFWYGKAPGLDRATDAFRHANLMGTHPRGGAVALVGDDPAAKSSSVPCTSERALADLGMPVFYPADPAEVLFAGRHAVALSRASGLWTSIKVVTAVADGSASMDLLADPVAPVLPEGSGRHVPSSKLLQPTLGPIERDFMTTRMRIVMDYLRLNELNRITGAPDARVGIVASGKTYLDVREAMSRLGLNGGGSDHGDRVRLLKLDVVWPLDPEQVRRFASGLDEIIVVEEKRAFIETLVREALYGSDSTPTITGKADPQGGELFASYGELDADSVTLGLAKRLDGRDGMPGVGAWLEERNRTFARERLHLPLIQRAPYYCSGCPHNTSTRPSSDSIVGAGIGCHAMVLLMDPKQVGDVVGLTQMGGEGTQWLGMAPFVKAPHFIQNLGDGTFHHSGSLAIRAAVASGRNITYRILYNSTVAMTGGQDAVGQMDVPAMVRNLLSEGVERIIVTTTDVKALRKAGLPRSVSVWPRERIGDAQEALAATQGTTVLIHEQECATELRRKRKRGKAAQPSEAVMINERLCEGCGDCGEKSNCLSVHPVATEFGRKTTVHQSSCNSDLTCLSGDCPAFMTITKGSGPSKRESVALLSADDLPAPPDRQLSGVHTVRLMGVGGTGVVTTSQVLAIAAVLSGHHVRTLDQTGLAQKGGAVVSDVKISGRPIEAGNKVGDGGCDLYLGYDLLVAVDPRNYAVLAREGTAIVSTSVVPTGAMVSDKSVLFPDVDEALVPIRERSDPERVLAFDARRYAEGLFGAEQFANMFLLGVALQAGALPLSAAAVEESITLNGVAVEKNVQSFRRGRQWISDRRSLDAALPTPDVADEAAPTRSSQMVKASPGSELERLVRVRAHELAAYQNEKYAMRYAELVERARAVEDRVMGAPGPFAEAVATYAFKLMAYKDEYEVARLALDTSVRDEVAQTFGADARIAWRLHPPTLRALGMKRKLSLGAWFRPALSALYRLRGLRGTPFDPFGRAEVRRVERGLVTEYEETISACLGVMNVATIDHAVRLAGLPDMVRGYEDIKLRSVAAYEEERVTLLRLLSEA
ncbi:indolepyruvate ferredoxin oxidoreductase family protein [Aeromicrobium sp.]|uniref:indolepyruvate ferredoxin oxidoreductase family protein n=1 Tax=Aeromicrobium sp. TaxID=1871063 RepID=UPI0025C5845D|nr:indolepyruvate ferredoxin oxidoreductase family protein [Aeromicrobium sp.]MCK5890323.1 indolepyruvate ferredoxin oxidoreductase family protein [Aeromicrobium sp.]